MNLRWTAVTAGVCLVCGFLLGVISQGKQKVEEPPAAAIHHKDGSITLERSAAIPPPPLPEPEGVEARTRAAIVELKPLPEPSTLQLDLVTMKDGTQRVTVKGPAVVGGQDFPISSKQHVNKWSAGVTLYGSEVDGMILKSSGHWSYGAIFGPIQRPNRAGVVILFQW